MLQRVMFQSVGSCQSLEGWILSSRVCCCWIHWSIRYDAAKSKQIHMELQVPHQQQTRNRRTFRECACKLGVWMHPTDLSPQSSKDSKRQGTPPLNSAAAEFRSLFDKMSYRDFGSMTTAPRTAEMVWSAWRGSSVRPHNYAQANLTNIRHWSASESAHASADQEERAFHAWSPWHNRHRCGSQEPYH